MNHKKGMLLLVLFSLFGTVNAEDWQQGVVYFNDESTVSGEIRMGFSIDFFYENEMIEVPHSALESIEFSSGLTTT